MRMRAFPLNAFLVTALASSGAFAGVYLESTDTDLAAKTAPKVSRMWFDGGRMRSERNDGDEGGNLAIFKNRTLYTIDPKSKSYRVIDQATVDRMGAGIANARKKMEAQMANMPPEQRAMMEKMMGQMGGAPGANAPKRILKNTGRAETVAGISCTVWEASVEGKKEEELCAAKPGSISGGDEVMKTLREIGEMMKGFTEGFGQNMRNAAAQPWNDMQTLNGVPILTRDFENGKATSETRLTVARKESVPGTQFEVPAGYKEKKMSLGPDSTDD